MENEPDFEYLRQVAKKYSLCVVDGFNALDEEQLKELSDAYQEIERKGHARALSLWIDDCFKNKTTRSGRQVYLARSIGGLLSLFRHLADRKIAPFASKTVRYFEEPFKKPDWSKLPKEFQFLGPFAEEYHGRFSEIDVASFLAGISEGKMEELARAAERIRLAGGSGRIYAFLDKHPDLESEEAMLTSLLELMDEADLNFD